MAYQLTLTGGQRDAFDWVGHRYNCGDKMADVLKSCLPDESIDADIWNEPGDITFNIPEYKAWEIRELHEQDCEGGHSGWACFDDELVNIMQRFVDKIV